jgi:hypothetical protein
MRLSLTGERKFHPASVKYVLPCSKAHRLGDAIDMDFRTEPFNPGRFASSASCEELKTVTIKIGASGFFVRISREAFNPPRPGILKSITVSCGLAGPCFSTASLPFAASQQTFQSS